MTLSGASAAKRPARSRKAKIWPRCGGLWSSTCNKHYNIIVYYNNTFYMSSTGRRRSGRGAAGCGPPPADTARIVSIIVHKFYKSYCIHVIYNVVGIDIIM